MKLYMFYIGGNCGNSNIELHDIRFSIGETPEACHDDLRRQWWGEPTSLHLDCWGSVEQADGFDVTLRATQPPPAGPDRLYFLNLGGYDPSRFEELHKNILVVGPDSRSATAKALAGVDNWSSPHRDRVFEVDKTSTSRHSPKSTAVT
jgi:hypothetical protein